MKGDGSERGRLVQLLWLAAAAWLTAAIPAGAVGEDRRPPGPALYPVDLLSTGPEWQGIGHISGGGATSRLLFSYPQPHLDAILDYLFLPRFGLSTQLLKVEIGGDGQSSEGVEPSHMHAADDLNYQRGYEWRLMVEAKKRNPHIRLGALAWTWPGWVGEGGRHASPWNDVSISVNYTICWIRGLAQYNLTLDIIDADWNERGWSPAFVVALRAALDAEGFAHTRILCGDDAHSFACADSLKNNAELSSAVFALGSHNPHLDMPPPSTGKVLVGSELEVQDSGGTDTPAVISSLFLNLNVTGFFFWNLVTSYYEGLFAWDQGSMLAYSPWSGNYRLSGRVWVCAHYTHHVEIGWHLLPKGRGSGKLRGGGGTYLSFVSPDGTDIAIVLHKPVDDPGQEEVSFALTGAPANLTYLQAWRSRMQTGRDADLDEYYLRQKDVPVSADGTVQSLTVLPGELWTLSTGGLGASVKGSHPPSPPLSPFPKQYSDDFDRCPRYQEPDYWTDQTGSWECVNATASETRGMVMRQSVPVKPVAWRPDEQRPMSIIGATQPNYDPQHRMQICAAARANSCTLSFVCLTICV